jgi:hypothetical protein
LRRAGRTELAAALHVAKEFLDSGAACPNVTGAAEQAALRIASRRRFARWLATGPRSSPACVPTRGVVRTVEARSRRARRHWNGEAAS